MGRGVQNSELEKYGELRGLEREIGGKAGIKDWRVVAL